MPRPLLTCLLAAFSALLFGQKTIDISKSHLDPGKRSFNISAVVDARRDRSCLGMCRTGMGNTREKLLLDRPLDEAMLGYFHQKMPDQSGLPSVALRVLRFAAYEDATPSRETAKLSADIEAYLVADGGFRLLAPIRIRKSEPGMDVTKFHDDNVRFALQDIVDRLRDSVNWKGLDLASLPAPVKEASLKAVFYPKIMTDTVFQPGIYRNISEFRANQPSRAMRLLQEGDKLFILIEKDGKPGGFRKLKPKDGAWGACDGARFWYTRSGAFFEMNRQPDGNFRFEGYDVEKVSQNAATAGAAFGVIGWAIASNTTKKNSEGLMQIDLETGGYWPVEEAKK